ncbi:MAG: hypothetical protein L3J35_08995 [Bacteroidales bacterium]|nr:hypothetical protein [Bacteroidales bacterium]
MKIVLSQEDSISVEKNIILKDSIILSGIQTNSITADSISVDSVKTKTISSDAIDQVIDYTSADSILFDLAAEKMYLYGIGDLSATDMNLKSAYVEISTDESYLYAKMVEDSSGTTKPILTQDKESFTVKSIKYNFKSKRALVIDTKMDQEQGFHLHADRGKMQSNKEFHIKNGKFTTCDLDHPHYYIRLSKAKKIPDKHVISGPMNFVIADIPLPIGLPFGLLPNQKQNSSGLIIPEYGEDVARGFYLRNGGYFMAINEKVNASLTGEVYSKGSWGLTLNSDFKVLYKFSGKLNFVYSKHRTGEKELPNSVVRNTFWVKSSYRQDTKANPNSTFSTNLDFGMSGHNDLNAKNISENANTQKSSNISYMWSKPGSVFNFSAKLGFSQNTKTQMTNLNLPTFSFNVKKQFPFKNLGTGSSKWYQKIGYSLNINAKNTVNTVDTLLFTRQTLNRMQNGLQYSVPVSTSFSLFEFINVAPSISYTGRLYAKYLNERNVFVVNNNEIIQEATQDTINKISHPFNFSISVPFSTKLYGTLNINKGRVQAIRHVMSPAISFNYNPDFSREFWGFYGYNSLDSISPYYSHTAGFIYGTPPTGRRGAIGLSIGNNFEMKLKNKNDTIEEATKIKLLDNLSVNTSYNLAVDSLNMAPIRIAGNTKLFGNFSARFAASFEPYAVDSVGKKINVFELVENKRIARFQNASFSVSGSLRTNKKKNKSASKTSGFLGNSFYYLNPDIPYTDFNIPWNLSINYDFVFNKTVFDAATQSFIPKTTQTASLNGSFSLTNNWKITASSRYDFSAKKFISANLSVYRDLHCWEMSFNVIPFGSWKSYTFRINIKSSVLKDLKYEKRKEVIRNYN